MLGHLGFLHMLGLLGFLLLGFVRLLGLLGILHLLGLLGFCNCCVCNCRRNCCFAIAVATDMIAVDITRVGATVFASVVETVVLQSFLQLLFCN